MHESAGFPGTARIERLRVQNYRVLRDLELRDIAPLTVLLGPNGSGKSTLFDVFAFLSECFTDGLRRAWDKRNRFRELRSRGADGPIVFELKYRERRGNPVITYHLAIDERRSGPVVAEEWLQWKRGQYGRPFRFLDFREGVGDVISGEQPELNDQRNRETLESPDLLAVNTLGQFARHPRVSALRRFISGWYLSYVAADLLADGRLLLQIKDEPFEQPILAKFASDGTLKMLAYLTVLYDPQPPPLIGIEEPENQLHPRLLSQLTEECRVASARSQLLVTTHSPYFVNGLRPNELWVLYRDDDGFARARPASRMDKVRSFMAEGAQLGDLWMEGYFEVGDPLATSSGPLRA